MFSGFFTLLGSAVVAVFEQYAERAYIYTLSVWKTAGGWEVDDILKLEVEVEGERKKSSPASREREMGELRPRVSRQMDGW